MSSWLGSAVEQQLLPLIREGIDLSLFAWHLVCYRSSLSPTFYPCSMIFSFTQVSAQLSMASGTQPLQFILMSAMFLEIYLRRTLGMASCSWDDTAAQCVSVCPLFCCFSLLIVHPAVPGETHDGKSRVKFPAHNPAGGSPAPLRTEEEILEFGQRAKLETLSSGSKKKQTVYLLC
jgi:hypothetical protein